MAKQLQGAFKVSTELQALLAKEMTANRDSNVEQFANEGEASEDLRLELAEGKSFSKGKKVDGND